uniref:hypothetical protein n=1 Tax=Gemmiger formicilis TaxID=745368 RepID=UPI003FEEDA98
MNKVRIKLHSAGVRALLKGAEMQDILKEQAAAVAARCGDGYEYRADLAQKRAVVDIYHATADARRDNYKNNTLEKALK